MSEQLQLDKIVQACRRPAPPTFDMQHQPKQSACANPTFEHGLIGPEPAAAWKGFPAAWIAATPHLVESDLTTQRNGLVMIDSGSTRAEFLYGARSRSYDLQPGSIGYFSAGTELKLSRWHWSDSRRIYVDLDAGLPGDTGVLESLGRLPRQTEFEFRDPELEGLLRMVVSEIAGGSPHGQLFAECLSLGVALRLQQRSSARIRSGERGKLTPRQVQRVDELIHAQLARNIGIAELARVTGFSTPQFVRLFKNTLGCTPHQYVLRARLEHAKTLVLTTDLPLGVAASMSGFASQSHMTSAFVKAFQVPPGTLRRRAISEAQDDL